LPLIDLSIMPPERQLTRVRAIILDIGALTFDLGKGPLLRAHLFRLAQDDHVLALTVHHIICDGWSTGVIQRELTQIYRALLTGTRPSLPPLEMQYIDYAEWQHRHLRGESYDRLLQYWRSELAEAPSTVEIPTDFQRPPAQTYSGAGCSIMFGRQAGQRIHELSEELSATPFIVLIAVFFLVMSRHSGHRDLTVGYPVAGRTRVEFERLIGFFVNTLP